MYLKIKVNKSGMQFFADQLICQQLGTSVNQSSQASQVNARILNTLLASEN